MKKWVCLFVLLIILEALSAALYLNTAEQLGFPLDDAWIHQTYARNLGLHGMMSFSPGVPSTGSTSPAWTVLLAGGYLLKIPFFGWAYVLGSIFAVASAYTAALLSHDYFGDFKRAVFVGVLCIVEWHLAWAALSGMEISLFVFLTLLSLLLIHRDAAPAQLGLIVGLAFLVRPEGIILASIHGLKLILENRGHPKQPVSRLGIYVAVFLIVISPWVLFNLDYNGRPFPNTISSKFMQYAYPWSIWKTLKYPLDALIYFLNGPLLLLVPAAGLMVYYTIRTKSMHLFPPLGWFLTLIGLYAAALPAIYHHGRYLMPLIPIVIIFGVEGMSRILEKLPARSTLRSTVWLVLAGMFAVLWVNGASTFSLQVRLLNESHLQAARWVDLNTPGDSIIATHDIGIVGYFTQRQIIDLAGLVTPEVIPIMGDQIKLAEFVREQKVDYLILFTGYYREMLEQLDARLLFSPNKDNLNDLNLEPFEVYEVP